MDEGVILMEQKHYIFFRDDDVRRLDHKFLKVFDLFRKNRIPIVYGVIPAKAEQNLLQFLSAKKKEYPGLFDIAQHGWLHKNYSSKMDSPKFEFGFSRRYEEQKKDIIQGYLKLLNEFKGNFDQIFIPPYHAYDRTTLKIINELGERENLKIFSAEKKTIPKEKNFLDIPSSICFAPPKYRKQFYMSVFLRDLQEKLYKNLLTGVLLHHDTYDEGDFVLLSKMLSFLKKRNNNSFIALSPFIKKKRMTKFDLTFEITNQCNLRCQMCNIWRERPKKNISFNDIQRVITRLAGHYSLGNVSLTGGEPFLNPDLGRIFRYLVLAKAKKQIDSIGIYTNGFASSTILAFLKDHASYLERCELGVSLDGSSSRHNRLRGKMGAYERTTTFLQKANHKFPQLKICAKFTISPANFEDLPQIYEFCKKNNISLFPKFAESGSKFYYHRVERKQNFNYKFEEYQKTRLKQIFADLRHRETTKNRHVVDSVILDSLSKFIETEGCHSDACFTPLYSLFFTAYGNIHPCLYQPPIGNINRKQWLKNIMSNLHFKIIQSGLSRECPQCFSYHGFLKRVNLGF
jgi:MoaA/NifB/PqqE/SkfB family radical SAM enzyme/peptidoglycan/xylan/chitin deacetylase (PgdA/CDA1 family)